jgi:hypothetical protein
MNDELARLCGPDETMSIQFHFSDPAYYTTLSALVSEIKLPILYYSEIKLCCFNFRAQIDLLKTNKPPKKKHFPLQLNFSKEFLQR